MKSLMLIACLLSLCSCSTFSGSFAPVAWGAGAYVAVPLESDEGETASDINEEGPSRKVSSEKKKKGLNDSSKEKLLE